MAKKIVMYVDRCAFKDADGKDIQKLARDWLGRKMAFFPDKSMRWRVVEHPSNEDEVIIIARFVKRDKEFDFESLDMEGNLDDLMRAIKEIDGMGSWVFVDTGGENHHG